MLDKCPALDGDTAMAILRSAKRAALAVMLIPLAIVCIICIVISWAIWLTVRKVLGDAY